MDKMNSISLKLFTFINIFFLTQSFAVSTERVLNFERECVEVEFEEGSELHNECMQRHEDLTEFLAESEEEVSQRAGQCSVGESVPTPEGLEALSDDITVASAKLSCTPEDQEEVASSCQDQLFCNAGRSVVRVLNTMPFTSGLARRTGEFFSSRVSSEQAESCSDQNNSDCLTEVFTSYVANLIGTVNSLSTIASGIGSAVYSIFWRNSEYVEEKSDDLHEFASTKASFVSRLFSEPGKTIMDSLSSFKESVDSWIKSEVFCQKWKRAPHATPNEEEIAEGKTTTCEKPLEAYSCLNCNDGLNAFCAGAGIFLSEGAIAMLTAGTATAARVGMRAGAMAIRGAAASRRGAQAISSKVPLMARISDDAASGATRGVASVSDEAVAATRSVSRLRASVESVKRVSEKFSDKISNLLVVRVITKPVRLIDDVAERMVARTVRRASLVKGSGAVTTAVRRAARDDYRRALVTGGARGARGTRAARVARLDNNGARALGIRRVVTASRFIRRTNGPRGSRRDAGGDSGPTTTNSNDPSPTAGGGDHSTPNGGGDPSSTKRGDDGLTDQQRADRDALTADAERQQQADREAREQREREEREREERERELRLAQAAEAAAAARRAATNPALRATRAALAADLAAKGLRAHENGASQVAEQMLSEAAINGENPAAIEQQSSSLIKSAIEERVGESFADSAGAAQFADSMNEIYSNPEKREEVIDNFVSERGLSRRDATRAYESERDFYDRASQGLSSQNTARNSIRAVAEATAAATRNPSAVVTREPSVSELIDTAQSIGRIKQSLSDLEAENKLIEQQIAQEEALASNGALVSPLEDELARNTQQARRSSRRREGLVASSAPSSSMINGTSPSERPSIEEDSEGAVREGALVSEEEKAEREAQQKTQREEEQRRTAEASEQSASESQLRLERSSLLSDLMNLLGSGETMSFRELSESERTLLSTHKAKLNEQLEMDSVRVFPVNSQGKSYLAFKDLVSNRTIFVEESSGRLMERIPANLF
jgi:hypothetical protein